MRLAAIDAGHVGLVAVADFQRPDRVIVGATSDRALRTMRHLYDLERMADLGLTHASIGRPVIGDAGKGETT